MRCINYLSEYLVPVVLFYIVGFAVLQKRPVFDDFIEGALAGLKTVAGILPTLVGLMAAVGVNATTDGPEPETNACVAPAFTADSMAWPLRGCKLMDAFCKWLASPSPAPI